MVDSQMNDLDGPVSVDLGLQLHFVLELQAVIGDLILVEHVVLQRVVSEVYADLEIEMNGLYLIGPGLL